MPATEGTKYVRRKQLDQGGRPVAMPCHAVLTWHLLCSVHSILELSTCLRISDAGCMQMRLEKPGVKQ